MAKDRAVIRIESPITSGLRRTVDQRRGLRSCVRRSSTASTIRTIRNAAGIHPAGSTQRWRHTIFFRNFLGNATIECPQIVESLSPLVSPTMASRKVVCLLSSWLYLLHWAYIRPLVSIALLHGLRRSWNRKVAYAGNSVPIQFAWGVNFGWIVKRQCSS